MKFLENIRKIYQVKQSELGRSMVEMLGVLAVVGILSIVGIMCYKYAMNKYQANTILADSKIVFTIAEKSPMLPSEEWEILDHTPESGKVFSVRKDLLNLPFVLVEDVNQAVCQQMLNSRIEGILDFYNLENNQMITCDETNEIIIDWNGQGRMATCNILDDCILEDDEFEGICDENHRCEPCNDFMEPNDEGTQCICSTTESIPCELEDGSYWCCGGTTICGEKPNECVESDMTCTYRIKTPKNEKESNCSVRVSVAPNVKKSTCTISVNVVPNTRQGNCWYDIEIGAEGESNMKIGRKCPAGQYCYLAYTDLNCGTSAHSNATGIIYGACHDLSRAHQGCPISTENSVVTQTGGQCPTGQYCYVAYADKGCTSLAGLNATGTLYGACHDLSRAYQGCPISTENSVVTQIDNPCPVGQYCYVAYADTECITSVNSNASGIIYGACHDLSRSYQGCPIATKGAVLDKVEECPQSTYCYLRWSDNSCANALSNISGLIYGACIKKSTNQTTCPVVKQ